MCLDLFQAPIRPPTPEAKHHVMLLKVLMWIQLSFGLIKLFLGMLSGSYGAFTDFICGLILYMAYQQINYSGLIFYIIIIGFDLVQTLCLFGKALQNGHQVFTNSTQANLKVVMVLISLVYQAAGIWVVFYAYREFKYISRAMPDSLVPVAPQNDDYYGYQGHNYSNRYDEGVAYQQERPVHNVQLSQPPHSQPSGPFQGRGVLIG